MSPVTKATHFFYLLNYTTYNVLLVKEATEGNLGGLIKGSGTIQQQEQNLSAPCFFRGCSPDYVLVSLLQKREGALPPLFEH